MRPPFFTAVPYSGEACEILIEHDRTWAGSEFKIGEGTAEKKRTELAQRAKDVIRRIDTTWTAPAATTAA